MSEAKLETYRLDEELVFVAKLERDPKSERGYRQTSLWRHCRERFWQRWAHAKPSRGIPDFSHEGKTGWWFPKAWVDENDR